MIGTISGVVSIRPAQALVTFTSANADRVFEVMPFRDTYILRYSKEEVAPV